MVQARNTCVRPLVECGWLKLGTKIVLVDFGTTQQTVPPDWELIVKKGEAQLYLVADAPGQVLQLRSNSASFSLQTQVHVPLQSTPYLAWCWKVTQLPVGGDFRQPHTDDQAAQLLVAFSATRFLSYIWDSTAPKGISGAAPAPPFRKILALVMQSGRQTLGTWITEKRNLVDDYTRLFGTVPEALEGLRIQINSQHTGSLAEAYWQSIVLTGNPHAARQAPAPRVAAWEVSGTTSRH
jgi:hypothetical protein